MAELFNAIAPVYQSGKMDNDLDSVFKVAATSGVVLLPGDGRPYTDAKGGPFEVADLLLPVDLKAWETLTKAHNAGMEIFPTWFSFKDGYFEFSQEEFCLAFIRCHHLERHKGKFMMDGSPATVQEVKQAIRRSLAIVRADAGGKIYGTYSALTTMVKDDEPAEVNRPRMTRQVLSEELESRGFSVKHNVITKQMEIMGRTEAGRVPSQDDLSVLLHDALADTYKGATFDVITQYVAFEARENEYNPVLDLLQSTAWDGVDRLPELFHLMGIDEDELSKALVTKWLLQSVALLFNDISSGPFGADGCLVLNGTQGAGKTSLFRHLAIHDSWFGEGLSIDDRDKDTTRRTLSTWLCELGEIESTFKSDVSRLKAFITNAVDHYRLPYGRSDTVAPRMTSLCATCNSGRYLVDETGNRRWWSIPFRRIIPREELLALDALQLWAQVFSMVEPLSYKEKSSCFRLTDEQRRQLAYRNESYEKPSKAQEEVEDILAQAKRDGLTFKQMTVAEFKEAWPLLRNYSTQQIGVALSRCGIDALRTKAARTRELPTPTPSGTPWRGV